MRPTLSGGFALRLPPCDLRLGADASLQAHRLPRRAAAHRWGRRSRETRGVLHSCTGARCRRLA